MHPLITRNTLADVGLVGHHTDTGSIVFTWLLFTIVDFWNKYRDIYFQLYNDIIIQYNKYQF